MRDAVTDGAEANKISKRSFANTARSYRIQVVTLNHEATIHFEPKSTGSARIIIPRFALRY